MNRIDNIRTKQTKEKIKSALYYLIKRKSFNEIFVKDICTIACINRSTFYQYYQDINDLMIQTENDLSHSMSEFFVDAPYYNRESFIKMFEFIKENADFYIAYLKNNEGSFMAENDFKSHKNKIENNLTVKKDYKENEIVYHLAFFSAGLKAICKVWLSHGMIETPEQMADIIHNEYSKKVKFFSQ